MKKQATYLILTSIVFIASLFSCNQQEISNKAKQHEFDSTVTYKNPVIKGFYPDPSICRVDSDYYLVTSSFEWFPGVPVFHSTDLVNWKQIGNALSRKSQLNLDSVNTSGGVWAPTIRYHEGTFYMITTRMHDGKNFYVTAKDPAGPWSEPIFIDMRCIDPSLYFDDDGKVYFTGTSPWTDNAKSGVYQAEIDIKTGKLLTEYKHLWTGTGGRYPEGPHIYKINDWYYLMISEGGTEAGHMVTIARSKSPWGPFESCPHNPILTNRNAGQNPVQNTGHADLVQAPDGKWWMVHLAVRSVDKYHHLGRETFLAAVNWNAAGWPVVNQDGTSSLEMYAVPPAEQTKNSYNGNYDFEQDSLGIEWNYLRNPNWKKYSLTQKPGYLCLTPSSTGLDDKGSPTFVGIRQKDFDVALTAKMQFSPSENNSEAGIAAFMNKDHYYAISLIRQNGKNFIQSTFKTGKIKHHANSVSFKGDEVFFRIKADKYTYQLYWSEDGENWEQLGENYAKYLSSEVAGGFTGTYLGMFAQSDNNKSTDTACFDWFKYEK